MLVRSCRRTRPRHAGRLEAIPPHCSAALIASASNIRRHWAISRSATKGPDNGAATPRHRLRGLRETCLANARLAGQSKSGLRSGMLKLDELVTRSYTLDEVAQGFSDLHAGVNIRGIVLFD